MRMTEAIYNGDTTSLETGILTLLSTSMSGPLLTILYNQSVRDDTPAGDSRDLTAAANAEIEEIGKGLYTAYVRCHIKKGVRSIGFTKEGIGRGPSLAIAITNGQASANQTCPSGTQARLCLKDSTVIPCPNLGN